MVIPPPCLCFNSMKVRLKQVTMNTHEAPLQFQFHEGPIKTHISRMNTAVCTRFNSMKVRLKLDFEAREHGLIMFQFHEGPIKTGCLHPIQVTCSEFQFHEGPIKTLVTWQTVLQEAVSIP